MLPDSTFTVKKSYLICFVSRFLICFVSCFFHKEGLRQCVFALTSDFCLSAARPGQREIDVCMQPPPPPPPPLPTHAHLPETPCPRILSWQAKRCSRPDIFHHSPFIANSTAATTASSSIVVPPPHPTPPHPPLSSRPIPGGGRVWWGWFTLTLSLTKVPGRGLGKEGGGGGRSK